jgi:hypothetical protein
VQALAGRSRVQERGGDVMMSINQLLASLVRVDTDLKPITDQDLKRSIEAAVGELTRRGWSVSFMSRDRVMVSKSTKL